MYRTTSLRILQLGERLDVPGLRKHVEWLHGCRADSPWPPGTWNPVPASPGRTRDTKSRGTRASRDRVERRLVAALARRIEKARRRLRRSALRSVRRGAEPFDLGRSEASSIARVRCGARWRAPRAIASAFSSTPIDLPAVLREEERERPDAAVEVDDASRSLRATAPDTRRCARPSRR